MFKLILTRDSRSKTVFLKVGKTRAFRIGTKGRIAFTDEGDGCFLDCSQCRAGVVANGSNLTVPEYEVQDGDVIDIGGLRIQVLVVDEREDTAASPRDTRGQADEASPQERLAERTARLQEGVLSPESESWEDPQKVSDLSAPPPEKRASESPGPFDDRPLLAPRTSPNLWLWGGALAALIAVLALGLWLGVKTYRVRGFKARVKLVDDLLAKKRYRDAIRTLDSLTKQYPKRSLNAGATRETRAFAQLMQRTASPATGVAERTKGVADFIQQFPNSQYRSIVIEQAQRVFVTRLQSRLGQLERSSRKVLASAHDARFCTELSYALDACQELDKWFADSAELFAPANGASAHQAALEDARRRHKEIVARLRDELAHETAIQQALAAASKALEEKDFAAAAAALTRLVEQRKAAAKDPRVLAKQRLVEKLSLVACTLKPLPHRRLRPRPALPRLDGLTIASSILMRRKTSAPAHKGVAACIGDGCCYVFDARSGSFLWSREVGYDIDFPPTVMQSASGRSLLLVGSAIDRSLAAYDITGKQAWRFVLPVCPTMRPIVAEPAKTAYAGYGRAVQKKLVCAPMRNGDIFVVDEEGRPRGRFQLGSRIAAPPTYERSTGYLYVPTEAGVVWVLDPRAGACVAKWRLGYSAGALEAGMLVLDRYLFFFLNDQPFGCRALGYEFRRDGTFLSRPRLAPIKPLRLPGWVWHRPTLIGGLIYVTTTAKEVACFRSNPMNPEEAFYPYGPPGPTDKAICFVDRLPAGAPSTGDESLAFTGDGVDLYRQKVTDMKPRPVFLRRLWRTPSIAVVALHPPQTIGQCMYFASRSMDSGYVRLTALDMSQEAQDGAPAGSFCWSVDMSLGSASPPVVVAPGLFAARGREGEVLLMRYNPAANELRLVRTFAASPRPQKIEGAPWGLARSQPLAMKLQDGETAIIMADAPNVLAAYRLDGHFRWRCEPAEQGTDSTPCVVSYGDKGSTRRVLIVGGLDGRVYALDLESPGTRSEIRPFQAPGSRRECMFASPAAYQEKFVFIGSDDCRLRKLAIRPDASNLPCLSPASEQDIHTEGPVYGRPVVSGKTVFFGDDAGWLYAAQADEMKVIHKWRVGGKVRNAFIVHGDTAYLCSERGKVYAVKASAASVLWTFPALSSVGRIVGPPALFRGSLYCCDASGYVYRVDPKTGREIDRCRLSVQPLRYVWRITPNVLGILSQGGRVFLLKAESDG